MNYKWAATHTLTFKEWKAEKFVEYQDALDYAEEKRPYPVSYTHLTLPTTPYV